MWCAALLTNIKTRLLSDTEIFENITEDFIGGDFAGDFAEVMEGFADVLGQEVLGQGIRESVQNPFQAA